MPSFDKKRVLLAILICLFSIITGFFSVSPFSSLYFVSRFGYWVIVVTFIWWVWCLIKCFSKIDLRTCRDTIFEHRVGAGLILLGVCLFVVHEPFRYKVLYDELVLAIDAMRLHYNREFITLGASNWSNGSLIYLGGNVDKRPMFFVFLVSCVHDLFGYRSNNVFYFNIFLTALCMVLTYISAFILGGKRSGVFAILLLIGLPLMGLNATGAGFEILNIVMILISMLLGYRYLRLSDDLSLSTFVLSVILLAQTRYESALFVASALLLIIQVWIWRAKISLPWSVLFAPLLLILVPLQNKVFSVNEELWQLPKGVKHPFGSQFYYDNVGHAIAFFFNWGGGQSNSIVLSSLGVLGVAFFWVHVWSNRKMVDGLPRFVFVLAAFGLTIMANFILILCYHWGQLDQYVVSRLSLPIYFFMVLCVAFILNEILKSKARIFGPAVMLVVFGIFIQSIPSQANATSTHQEMPSEEIAWQRDEIRVNKKEDALYIMASPLLAMTERTAAITPAGAERTKAGLCFHMRQSTYRYVYVFQRLEMDLRRHEWRIAESDKLDDDFVLETLDEHNLTPLYSTRLSRLVKIKNVADDKVFPVKSTEGAGPVEAYYNMYYKQLPW